MSDTEYVTTELSTLTPAEIDTLWVEALAPVHKLWAQGNALDTTAGRYAKAGSSYATQAQSYHERAQAKYQEANALRSEVSAPFLTEWESRHGWTRAYIVPDGHIHRSTSCHSLHITTLISWLPEQSGLTEEEIIEFAGIVACTHCYPTAPVDALRAALAAKKDEGECPGSRSWDHDSSGMRYSQRRARCNHCGQTISATSTGKLRAHKPKEANG